MDHDKFEVLKKMIEDGRADDAKWREDFEIKMQPILDTYYTVGRVGGWGKAFLGLIAVILTIIVAWQSIVHGSVKIN